MNIQVKGLDELNRKLAALARDCKPQIEKATQNAVLYVHSTVPPYPAPPPNSTYRRTETLGRSITTEVKSLGSQIVGTIGTATVYAPWVISDRAIGDRGPQAWMHAGRWWTLQAVVRKARAEVVKIYRQAIHDLLEKRG
jgi:hypothetical protein